MRYFEVKLIVSYDGCEIVRNSVYEKRFTIEGDESIDEKLSSLCKTEIDNYVSMVDFNPSHYSTWITAHLTSMGVTAETFDIRKFSCKPVDMVEKNVEKFRILNDIASKDEYVDGLYAVVVISEDGSRRLSSPRTDKFFKTRYNAKSEAERINNTYMDAHAFVKRVRIEEHYEDIDET